MAHNRPRSIQPVRPVRVLASQSAAAGSNLILTIDQGLQQKFTASLQDALNKSGATQAAGVALDPATMRSSASTNFNENLFSQGIDDSDYNN